MAVRVGLRFALGSRDVAVGFADDDLELVGRSVEPADHGIHAMIMPALPDYRIVLCPGGQH